MIKAKFKKKWSTLALNHKGQKIHPFPGKNPVRWALVDVNKPKIVPLYEGKPSIQAIELAHNQKETVVYLMEFDRSGNFFVQHFTYGQAVDYDYAVFRPIWEKYHKEHTFREVVGKLKRRA